MIRRAALVAVAAAVFAFAGGTPVEAIVDLARGTPVEIFSDVVFHLLETNQIPERDRVPLLDEVFLRATDARRAMPERPAIIPGQPRPTERPSGLAVRAEYLTAPMPGVTLPAQVKLDALSIQCGVVLALLGIDGKHARELFSRIRRPNGSKPDCKTAILEDTAPYFEAVEELVTHAPFTAKEQEDRVPFWTMEGAVRGIQTSLEIIPAARDLSYLAHDQKDALAMTSAFAAALGIDDSDRNFGAAVGSNLLDAVQLLEDRFAKLGVPPQTLQSALRGYLVRHLSGARCEDSATDYAGVVAAFNAAVAGQTAVAPISAEESTPSKTEGKAEIHHPVDDPVYREIVKGVDALAKDPDASTDALAKLHAWKGADGDDPVDVFRRKVGLNFQLQGLRTIGPVGLGISRTPLYLAAMEGLIATLGDADILDRAPGDWLVIVRDLARTRICVEPNGQPFVFLCDLDAAQAMASSSFSALQVYGRLAILEYSRPSPLTNPGRN